MMNMKKNLANNTNISADAFHLFYDLIIGKGSYGKVFFGLSILEKTPAAMKFLFNYHLIEKNCKYRIFSFIKIKSI